MSAAHCNLVFKVNDKLKSCSTYPFQDEGSNIVEICCCRKPTFPESCLLRFPIDDQRSSYCGKNPSLQLAKPSELNIVCSEHSLAIQPEQVSPEKELVLEIMSITNFPGYQQGTESDTEENLKGPYAGGDIAVYLVSCPTRLSSSWRWRAQIALIEKNTN